MDDRRLQELLAKVDRYYGSLNPDQLAKQVEATQQVYDQYFNVHSDYDIWMESGTAYYAQISSDTMDCFLTTASGERIFIEARNFHEFEVPYQVRRPAREQEQVVVTMQEGILAS